MKAVVGTAPSSRSIQLPKGPALPMVSINTRLEVNCSTYSEYRLYYNFTHGKLWTRRLHVLATAASAVAALFAVLRLDIKLLLCSVLSGYAICWGADACIDKSQPASFKHPYWAFRANMDLLKDVLMGNTRI